jgi:hypothetical protein
VENGLHGIGNSTAANLFDTQIIVGFSGELSAKPPILFKKSKAELLMT